MKMKFLGTAETVSDYDKLINAEINRMKPYIVTWIYNLVETITVEADSKENAKQDVIAYYAQVGMHVSVLNVKNCTHD